MNYQTKDLSRHFSKTRANQITRSNLKPTDPDHRVLLPIALSLILLGTAASTASGATHHKAAAGGGSSAPPAPVRAPQNPLEHNNLGVEYGTRGNWEAAVSEHALALNGDPYNEQFKRNLSAALLRYGKALMQKGDMAGAMKKLRFSLYVDSNNAEADDVLSSCIKKTGKDPNNPAVRRALGDEADEHADYIDAIAEYRKYARMLDTGPSHAALARVLMKQGQSVPERLVEGYQEMRIALKKDWKKTPDEQRELASCHALMGDTLKEHAQKALEDGRTQVAMVRLQNAAQEYRRAAVYNPANGDAYRGLIEVAREAVSINPKSFDNHLMLGGAYQLAGDFEHAKHEYEQCWAIDKGSPALAQARKSFHLAVATSPSATMAMKASSVQKLEDSLRTNPNDPETLYVYGRGKESMGDKEIALQAYMEAAKQNPFVNPDLGAAIQRVGGTPPRNVPISAPPVTAAAAPSAGTAPTTTAAATPPSSPFGAASATTPAAPGAATPPGSKPPAGTAPDGKGTAPPGPQNQAVLNAAQAKLSSGDVDGAQKDLLALVDKDPKDPQAWFLLGSTHEKKGDLEEASVAYRQAAYLNNKPAAEALQKVESERARPLIEEGEKAFSTNNLVAAADSFKEAVGRAPNVVSIRRRYVEVLKKFGDDKEAERQMKRIEELEKQK